MFLVVSAPYLKIEVGYISMIRVVRLKRHFLFANIRSLEIYHCRREQLRSMWEFQA